MNLLEHCGHRLTVMPDSDESAAGLLCETCGEYVFEMDDVEIVDALDADTQGTSRLEGEIVRLRDMNDALRHRIHELQRELERRRPSTTRGR